MKNVMHMLLCLLGLALIAGCAPVPKFSEEYWVIDKSNHPSPDIALNVPSLGPCTDNPDRTLHLNSNQPVTVLVHGCMGSTGLFRGLAQVMAFRGQQTKNKNITVIGHSQGALLKVLALLMG